MISQVQSKRDFKRFLQFPYHLYNHVLPKSAWVAPLRMSVQEQLNPNKNPFFKEGGQCHHFIATDLTGNLMGRFSLSYSPTYVQKWNHSAAFFGFYEQMDDLELAKNIFRTAKQYAKQLYGANDLLGPINISTNYQLGMLVDTFGEHPYIDMPYNPPYYPQLFETSGYWQTAMDLYAYHFDARTQMNPKVHRVVELLKKRHNIEIRTANFKDFAKDNEIMREIYNDAWSENWGFIPLSKPEWDFISKDMTKIAREELILIGTIHGEPCGFSAVLPDLNMVLRKIPTGKLLPTGIFKLLLGQKKINRGRLLVLGIKKKYQHLGLGSIFYTETHTRGHGLGYTGGELSWILESNHTLINTLKQVNAQRAKTYRLYKSV